MLKLASSDAYWFPVNVEFVGENGRRNTQTFDAKFKRLSRDQYQEKVDEIQRGALKDADLVAEMMIDWRGIQDEDGSPLEFSEASRDRVCALWPVLPSIVMAWFESYSPKAQRKN